MHVHTNVSSGPSAKREMNSLSLGPQVDKDVAKYSAEKGLNVESSSEEDSGTFNVNASPVTCMKSEMSETLSKRQLKKQKKKEKWLAYRPVKR
jgi:hypothetical protein